MYRVKKNLSINGNHLEVEIADTDFKRAVGLMYREELEENSGMLFVFPDSRERSFWMKDTNIPLSIAYMNNRGEIINIEHMNPHDLSGVKSIRPCKYALEVNQGWFESKKIKPGNKIRIKK